MVGGEGRCRERRYADHIFIQIYFRKHHFVAKFSKFSSPQAARKHWPPNQNPADAFAHHHQCHEFRRRQYGTTGRRLENGGRVTIFTDDNTIVSVKQFAWEWFIKVSSRIRRERIYTGPHRVGPNRPGWARSISALKLLNILRDVTTNMAEQQEYLISDGSISKIIKYFSDGSI